LHEALVIVRPDLASFPKSWSRPGGRLVGRRSRRTRATLVKSVSVERTEYGFSKMICAEEDQRVPEIYETKPLSLQEDSRRCGPDSEACTKLIFGCLKFEMLWQRAGLEIAELRRRR
jgi:hypothetical protein